MTPSERAWIAWEFTSGRRQVDIASDLKITPGYVNSALREFCDEWSGVDVYELQAYGSERRMHAVIALERYRRATGGEMKRPVPAVVRPVMIVDRQYIEARREHAWRLRTEGLTLRIIGERLGVSVTRARQLVWRGEIAMAKR
jgi:hypothetical protein